MVWAVEGQINTISFFDAKPSFPVITKELCCLREVDKHGRQLQAIDRRSIAEHRGGTLQIVERFFVLSLNELQPTTCTEHTRVHKTVNAKLGSCYSLCFSDHGVSFVKPACLNGSIGRGPEYSDVSYVRTIPYIAADDFECGHIVAICCGWVS